MEPALIGACICAVFTVIVGGFARRAQQVLKRVDETPRTVIRELTPGFREIGGAVIRTGDALTSPISQTPCVHFDLLVQERVVRPVMRNGLRMQDEWRTVLRDEQDTAFCLDDGTGQCDVLVEGAELMIRTRAAGESGWWVEMAEELEESLRKRYRFSPRGFLFPRTLRYSERVIREGDHLYAVGTVHGGPMGRLQMSKSDDVMVVADREEELVLAALQRRAVVLGFATITLCIITLALLRRGIGIP